MEKAGHSRPSRFRQQLFGPNGVEQVADAPRAGLAIHSRGGLFA
jgi:hypothetical protein